jgi:hypothetical protein
MQEERALHAVARQTKAYGLARGRGVSPRDVRVTQTH